LPRELKTFLIKRESLSKRYLKKKEKKMMKDGSTDISKIYDEEREEYNRDEPSDSKDKWEKIGLKLEDE
jgi:hypothetical protein